MAVPLNVAFIGCGAVNFGGKDGPWNHSKRLEELSRQHPLRFVAIVDIDVGKARRLIVERSGRDSFGELYTGCQTFASVSDMYQSCSPDVCFIGLPPFAHGSFDCPVEIECLTNNSHIFVEKPVSNATDLNEVERYGQEVTRISKEKGLFVSVGYMFRYSKWLQELRRIVNESSTPPGNNPIVNFWGRYNCSYANIPSPFWWDTKTSGGPIVEQLTHFIDLARVVVGEVNFESISGTAVSAPAPSYKPKEGQKPAKKVVGELDCIPIENEDSIPMLRRIDRSSIVSWKFESGAIGCLIHGALLQGERYEAGLEVTCDGLRVRVEEPYGASPALAVLSHKSDEEHRIVFEGDDPYHTEVKQFLAAITDLRDAREAGTYSEKHRESLLKKYIYCDFEEAVKTYVLSRRLKRSVEALPASPSRQKETECLTNINNQIGSISRTVVVTATVTIALVALLSALRNR